MVKVSVASSPRVVLPPIVVLPEVVTEPVLTLVEKISLNLKEAEPRSRVLLVSGIKLKVVFPLKADICGKSCQVAKPLASEVRTRLAAGEPQATLKTHSHEHEGILSPAHFGNN